MEQLTMEWGDSLNWVASASTLRDTLKKSIASQDHVNHLEYEVIIDQRGKLRVMKNLVRGPMTYPDQK